MTQPIDFTPRLLSWSLTLAQVRAQVASTNIANAHTDGFAPQQVDFERQVADLQAASGDPASLEGALDRVQSEGLAIRPEPSDSLLGAQVNEDQEVMTLVSATTQYQSLVEGLNRYFALQRLAITSQE